MQDYRLTYQDLALYFAIGNILLGLLFGSFPLILGLKLKNRKYGVFGFVGSVVGGALLGILLSYPIALIFSWLILRGSSSDVTVQSGNTTDQLKPNSTPSVKTNSS